MCGGGHCAIYVLVPLRHGEVVRHHSSDMPDGAVVDLQMHDQQWLGEHWLTVASAPVSVGHDGLTPVPYSGWYRFRLTVPGDDSAARWYCATVKR